MSEQIANSFLEKARRGELAATLSVRMVRTNEIVVMAKAAGFDGIMLDMEHSTFDLDTVSQLCIAGLAAGIAPLVRVPSADPSLIARVLDGGALGVIVPHIKTVQDVVSIVQAAKFPPVGHRSETGALPHFQYRPLPRQISSALSNESTLVIPMIETLEAVGVVEEIAAVPGVGALFLGGSDLSAEMGIPGQYDDPRFVVAYTKVLAAGNKEGVIVGLGGFQSRMDLVAKLGTMGARWVSAATDSSLFFSGAAQKSRDIEVINCQIRGE
ncbi:Pyruvate/Phosphoenolpyruvate kinase [Niveomyces insectorum RCEF 264]|uniref:Pyruvate/Phosphoenolpyruvate kinase n=1 Tax=Niveomyces insectorum RCEF 264 TaxID=1081102 RepID=A0A167Y025_9HYPO|nr:Pyruvate/Phosphoenolpyruvate kinase [Niveomyces insectorum RCEF 264]